MWSPFKTEKTASFSFFICFSWEKAALIVSYFTNAARCNKQRTALKQQAFMWSHESQLLFSIALYILFLSRYMWKCFFLFVLLPFSLYFFSSALLVEEITVEVLTQQKMSKHGRFFFPFNVVVVNAFIEKWTFNILHFFSILFIICLRYWAVSFLCAFFCVCACHVIKKKKEREALLLLFFIICWRVELNALF